MKTHKTALYVRVAGDKFRPLKVHRPTLRQMGARLRRLGRRIGVLEKHTKEGHESSPFLVRLRRMREGMQAYLANIGNEHQGDLPKSNNLRLGARKHQPFDAFA